MANLTAQTPRMSDRTQLQRDLDGAEAPLLHLHARVSIRPDACRFEPGSAGHTLWLLEREASERRRCRRPINAETISSLEAAPERGDTVEAR